MAFSYVGQFTNLGGDSSDSTVTVSTMEAGNLIVFSVSVDKSAGTFTGPGDGWAMLEEYISSSISLYTCYKISAGTETDVTVSWSSGNRYYSASIMEYSATGAISIDLSADDDSGGSSVTTLGVTMGGATDQNDSLLYCAFGQDSGVASNGVFSDDITATPRYIDEGEAGGQPVHAVGDNLDYDIGTPTATFTGDKNDQMAGMIACFKEAVGGGNPWYYYAQQ